MKINITSRNSKHALLYLVIVIVLIPCSDGSSFLATRSSASCSRRVILSAKQIHLQLSIKSSITPIDENEKDKNNKNRILEPHNKKTKTKKKSSKEEEYEDRKQQWLDRYGSLEALQKTFGTADTAGNLSPQQTRRLYHSLLPRSLLGLYEMKLMKPEELAPLAFEARMAAKQYARSRSVWYARLGTVLFDQYRTIRDNGLFAGLKKSSSSSSMTWEEIYSKYETQIVQEECSVELEDANNSDVAMNMCRKKKFNEEELAMRIYLRILEKSCVTNQAFDQMFLKNQNQREEEEEDDDDIVGWAQMSQQLDQDVREILLPPKKSAKVQKKMVKLEEKQLKEKLKEEEQQEEEKLKEEERQEKEARKQEKQRLKEEKKQLKEMAKDDKMAASSSSATVETKEDTTMGQTASPSNSNLSQKEQIDRFRVLRILAGTRRKFRKGIQPNT